MTKNEAIEELWQIIDDIDTISDVAKYDDKLYRRLVEKHQATRWNLPITTDGVNINLSKLKDD